MSVLARYISRRFVSNLILLLASMVALSLTFELMEEADEVLASTHGGISDVLRYSALRLPDIVSRMHPIAVLLGTIITLGLMQRHAELIAAWSSGVSALRIMRALIPIGLVLVAAQFALEDRAVPKTVAALQTWGVGDFERGGFIRGDEESVWLRSNLDIVQIPAASALAGRIENLQVFLRNNQGLLIEQLTASSARRDSDHWLLLDVTRRTLEPPTVDIVPQLIWNGRIEIENVALLARDLKELPIHEIDRLIDNEGFGQRPVDLYRTWYQYRLASALKPLLLILLVVALAQRFRREGGFGHLIVSSVAIGFGYFVFDGASLAMGEAGFLPPWLAAWGPNLALLSIVGTIVARHEG